MTGRRFETVALTLVLCLMVWACWTGLVRVLEGNQIVQVLEGKDTR